MATLTVLGEAPARSDWQRIEHVCHPVARRIGDVLRSRSNKPKTILIDDVENIKQAALSGLVFHSLFVTDFAAAAQVGFTSFDADIPLYLLANGVAQELFGDQKRSRVFALARSPRTPKLRDLRGTLGDIVVLDGVRLVGNIGAIARTACALGMSGIILLDSGLNTTYDRRLIRASRGHVFSLPLVIASRRECLEFLQREKISIATLSADAGDPLNMIRHIADRLALVLGGERDGVSSGFDAHANHRYSIPMAPAVESLNVSVAAGIALYERVAG